MVGQSDGIGRGRRTEASFLLRLRHDGQICFVVAGCEQKLGISFRCYSALMISKTNQEECVNLTKRRTVKLVKRGNGGVLFYGVQHITTSMSQVVPRRHNEFWGLIGTVLGHDLDTMEDSARLPAFGLLMK